MSEERGEGHGSFLWENHSWAFSDNSGGDVGGGSEEKSSKKPLELSSNSPTGTVTTAAPVGQKRRRRNGVSKNGKGGGGEWINGCKSGGGGDSDHGIHIWTERERRKKMRNMFSSLHALLPQTASKDKSTIVDEAVNYVKTLQHSLHKLQKQRLDMLRGATTTIDYEPPLMVAPPPPVLAVDSREAFLADQVSSNSLVAMSMNSSHLLSIPHFPCCFQTWSSPNVVLSVSGDDARISVCSPTKPGMLAAVFCVLQKHKLEVVTAQISSDYYRSVYMIHAHASGISDQLQEALSVEEIYKLAVGEIIFWLSSC